MIINKPEPKTLWKPEKRDPSLSLIPYKFRKIQANNKNIYLNFIEYDSKYREKKFKYQT